MRMLVKPLGKARKWAGLLVTGGSLRAFSEIGLLAVGEPSLVFDESGMYCLAPLDDFRRIAGGEPRLDLTVRRHNRIGAVRRICTRSGDLLTGEAIELRDVCLGHRRIE